MKHRVAIWTAYDPARETEARLGNLLEQLPEISGSAMSFYPGA